MDEPVGQFFASLMRSRAAKRNDVPPSAARSEIPAPVQAAPPMPEPPIDVRRTAIPKRPTSDSHQPGEAAPPIAPWAQQFRSPQGLLGAIVAGEVLGPPKSLR
jgi:hypothetical protein